jgi:glycosyltransferase involved in cell wall biosynthesis
LTFNEERNLPLCLKSVTWTDDVVVFDSFSTDRTLDIARAAGVRILQRRFDDYGSQREAARVEGEFKYPWLLVLDADEEPDAELVAELQAIAGAEGSHDAYRMRRKDYFLGKWIKHCTYPIWYVRFFRHEHARYEPRSVHEYPSVSGTVGELNGHLIHHSFNKGLADWWAKHIRYAQFEAQESLKTLRAGQVDWAGLFSFRDPVRHRRALKSLSMRLPFRPLLRFLYMYVLRLGLLDGGAGLTYCRLLAMYEYMIVLHMKELQRRENGLGM